MQNQGTGFIVIYECCIFHAVFVQRNKISWSLVKETWRTMVTVRVGVIVRVISLCFVFPCLIFHAVFFVFYIYIFCVVLYKFNMYCINWVRVIFLCILLTLYFFNPFVSTFLEIFLIYSNISVCWCCIFYVVFYVLYFSCCINMLYLF